MKTNALAKLKTMFTQEVFTEQVVASHAVKVSVTCNLNADMKGFLPVHCVYQVQYATWGVRTDGLYYVTGAYH